MRIPSTQALRALEAFARLGSVWRAADDLNLTRSAVSHQLRTLERDLGFELLQRHGKGIALTPLGRRYAEDVGKALLMIGDAGAQYGDASISGPLRISCAPGLASLWLCPHIGEFQDMFPNIALSITTPRQKADIVDGGIDAFVSVGQGHWPGYWVELLRDIVLTPLCSPALLNNLGGLAEPSALLRATLLYFFACDDWLRWFAAARVSPANPKRGILFSDLNLILAATTAGQGVALADPRTCQDALATGLLVRPFDLSIPSQESYYLVAEPKKLELPVVAVFIEWVKSRLAQTVLRSR